MYPGFAEHSPREAQVGQLVLESGQGSGAEGGEGDAGGGGGGGGSGGGGGGEGQLSHEPLQLVSMY